MKKNLLLTVLALLISFAVSAQESGQPLKYFLPQGNFTYNPKITTPEQFFGFKVGDQHLSVEQVQAYYKKLAEESNRFTIETNGRTYEYRPMLYATVTSPENHARLEELLAQHNLLSDPTKSASLKVDNMPVVIWLGYSVHGNEASGMNGSIPVAYFLAAAQGEEIDNILANSIIVMDPSQNPDGGTRFAAWVNSARSFTPVTDPVTREFSNEPWPGSRSNHYWFDLNRDWLCVQHPESQSKIDMYLKYRPNILNDHHEQGSNANFFFMPGEKMRTNPLTYKGNWDLTRKVADFHAAEMDAIKSYYYSTEGYDDFYYGKGSTYPDIHGAIGMLFEQGSSRGHVRSTTNGILTFAEASRNQTVTSYSTIRAAMKLKNELLKYQRDSYTDAYKESKSALFDAYVFGTDDTKGINYHFLDILLRQGIDVYRINRPIVADGITYSEENSYMVPVTQQEARKIKTIFENERNFLDSAFYDISGWTLVEATNLPKFRLSKMGSLKGEKVTSVSMPKGAVIGGEASYAYLFNTNEYYVHKMIYELLEAGLQLQLSDSPFDYKVDGKSVKFGYGSVVVRVPKQPLSQTEIYRLISRLAEQTGVTVYAADSGVSEDSYLGSKRFSNLSLPKVAMLIGQGAASLSAGEVWHLFDQRFRMPLTLMDNSSVSESALKNYNVLIVTGNHSSLSKGASDAIAAWVKNGGTLVALGSAWSMTNAMGLTALTTKPRPAGKALQNMPYSEMGKERVGSTIDGVLLNAYIDPSHPIAYGYNQKQIPVYHSGTTFFREPKDAFNTPLRYTKDPVLSGFVSYSNVKQLAETPAVMVGSAGRGKVIVFNDNPNFRAFWFGTNKLFMNSIFFAPAISASKLESVAPAAAPAAKPAAKEE